MTTQTVERAASEHLKTWAEMGRGPCLIPKPGRPVPSCHEYDFCACHVHDAFLSGASWEREHGKAADLVRYAETALKHILAQFPEGYDVRVTEIAREALQKLRAEVKS